MAELIGKVLYGLWVLCVLAAPQVWSRIGAWIVPVLIVWPFVALLAESEWP